MASPFPKITKWFEALTPATLATIGEVYAENAHFKDPFNDVLGIDKIHTIYAHMFDNLTNPRFEIMEVIEDSPLRSEALSGPRRAFVAWQFKFEWRGKSFDIPGGTRFAVNEFGRVVDHVDYWDVAAGLYERLPLLGCLLRALRKRMAAL